MIALFALVASAALGGPENTQRVCAGSIAPGYILVNDEWSPTSCGNPTSITYNVWIIESYSNKPVGSTMRACLGTVPSGWVMVNTDWTPTACGHPTDISHNMMTIKRLQ